MHSRLIRAPLAGALCLTLLCMPGYALAAVVWNESTGGDLSSNPNSPTQINLALGTNSLLATMPGDDLDFFSILLPAGAQLNGLIQAGYVGADMVSFIAVGPGTQLSDRVLEYDPAGLLGYTHFGPGFFSNGSNILPDLGAENFGVPGFTPPLTGSAYSFWVQQESNLDVSYQLDFVVTAVPEPAASILLVLGCCLFAGRRRTR
jgi:hypothetical protein